MKIAFYSSKRERCGISTYTDLLAQALSRLGHEVKYLSSLVAPEVTRISLNAWPPDVFHIQHEPSIMPKPLDLWKMIKDMRRIGIKAACTLHTEDEVTIAVALRSMPAENLLIHRQSETLKGATVITMPCPAYAIPEDIRKRKVAFGFPEDAMVVSTVGFMIPWKSHPKIAEMLLPWLLQNPKIHLQVIASTHFNPDLLVYANGSKQVLAMLSAAADGRIHHVSHYPSDEEVLDRLAVSDLGYTWCPMDTGSASAAAAMFTSARCPLVASNSTHYATLGAGTRHAPKTSLPGFVQMIREVAGNAPLLGKLKAAQERLYTERNYDSFARNHAEFYERMT